MAAALALAAAVSWGASDFLGGLAGRRAEGDVSISTSLTSHVIGVFGLTVAAALVGGAALGRTDLLWSVGAGAGGAVGVALLYRGLAIGRMGVVAPVTGVGAAAIPVLVGIWSGETPSPQAWLGVGLALVAIVMVSREPGARTAADADASGRDHPSGTPATAAPARRAQSARTGLAARMRSWLRTPGLREAVGSGAGFGTIFVLLDRTPEAAGLWPLVPMKLASITLLVGFGLLTRRGLVPPRVTWPLLVGTGVLDNLANVAYLLAVRRGLLALVAVLSSLYPVVTVVLARTVLAEHLARSQVAGLALAIAAVGLIGTG